MVYKFMPAIYGDLGGGDFYFTLLYDISAMSASCVGGLIQRLK